MKKLIHNFWLNTLVIPLILLALTLAPTGKGEWISQYFTTFGLFLLYEVLGLFLASKEPRKFKKIISFLVHIGFLLYALSALFLMCFILIFLNDSA